jgi:Fe-S cluster assembly protein SufD
LSDTGEEQLLPPGLRLQSLAEVLATDPDLVRRLLAQNSDEGDSLQDLNTALLQGGFLLTLEEGIVLERPLELHHLADGNNTLSLHHARNFIRLDAGSRLQIVESFSGGPVEGAYLRNPITRVDLAAGAELQHFCLQREKETAFHLAKIKVDVAEKADYRLLLLNLGARLSRLSLRVELRKAASFNFKAAQVLDATRHGDITTEVNHLAPESVSDQTVKQILDDAARGVYQGRIQVHPGALQSDGHQLSRALLLSDKAEADAKPELEIYADDVKCSHGCTFGDLDEDALFYLRSRGIPAAKARALLVEAFLVEIFEEQTNEDLAAVLRQVTADALHSLGQGGTINFDDEAGRA